VPNARAASYLSLRHKLALPCGHFARQRAYLTRQSLCSAPPHGKERTAKVISAKSLCRARTTFCTAKHVAVHPLFAVRHISLPCTLVCRALSTHHARQRPCAATTQLTDYIFFVFYYFLQFKHNIYCISSNTIQIQYTIHITL
jgi:hypothetical protein